MSQDWNSFSVSGPQHKPELEAGVGGWGVCTGSMFGMGVGVHGLHVHLNCSKSLPGRTYPLVPRALVRDTQGCKLFTSHYPCPT